jgi:hypothetical protein
MLKLRGWLAGLRRPEPAPGRVHAPSFEEDQVRDRIYGWHSGTVEPPQPLDSSRLEAVQLNGDAAEQAVEK